MRNIAMLARSFVWRKLGKQRSWRKLNRVEALKGTSPHVASLFWESWARCPLSAFYQFANLPPKIRSPSGRNMKVSSRALISRKELVVADIDEERNFLKAGKSLPVTCGS